MKKVILSLAAVVGLVFHGWTQTNEPAASSAGIAFADLNFDFGKVDSGTLVKHDFIFTNTGNQTLEITNVKTSCGCTTAGNWDKKVEPGKIGKIPVQFKTSGYGGVVHKAVFVDCNDPAHAKVTLNLRGTVWKAFTLSPPFAVFNLKPEGQSNQTLTIKITSNDDKPVTIFQPVSTNPAFKPELTTVKEGKEYELHITAVVTNVTGSISAPITLDTTSSKVPTISLTTFIMMQPLLSVSPPQIMLPAGPLHKATKYMVTIMNNGTKPVVLSDPEVNANGVKVELSERQPGREFNVTVSFPAGFQSAYSVQATVKSDNPKYPTVTIPVYQPLPPQQNKNGHAAAPTTSGTTSVASRK